MSKSHEASDRNTFKQNLSLILQKNSFILLGILAVLVLVIIGLFIYNSIQAKKLEKFTQKIETIQDDYEKLATLTDATAIVESKKAIFADLEKLIQSSPKNYALQRGLFIRANLFYQDKDWEKSIADFKKLAASFPNSYLAPISLINEGSALEEFNKIDEAIAVYQLLIKNYSSTSSQIANIYFSIGRLLEEKKDFKAAIDEYNTLLDNYPDSNWTNLARSRIIFLETK